ncbi:hypothetical protein AMK26_14540 [Streptomyces sp. CB03234]|uniref:DUF2470 domain-containing protein n=1 Tax=Streptomyces sp. (strain CB03234) TaxID=1703937 RepID=UPI000938EF37|nr:DUF2470 domain-containing protein [Streptomyces sp. CB03234]OKK04550.1 hypothetical protein AMK26_14540 [Streptomyces sp. CB03234]
MSAPDAPAAFMAADPSAAERIRSVLARAQSLSLTMDGHRHDLVGGHTIDDRGRLTLHPPAGSPPVTQAASAPGGAVAAALLEFTDIAATSVRDRVRARVTLSGRLTRTHDSGLRLDTERATLETAAGTVTVGRDELVLAEADPLAVHEAAMLTHLADAHDDVVTRLTRLAEPRLLHGVVRVQPLALDRHGITLRCEYARGHRDVRILFPAPVREPGQAGEQIRHLLAAARACPHHRRVPPARLTGRQ